MTATLNDVTKRKPVEASAEQQAAAELVRLAKEQGLSLTGPDGLLKQQHHVEQYANNGIEADHGRLKHRLRPMRGQRTDRSARVIIAGLAFIENIRRGHYEFATDTPTTASSRSCIHQTGTVALSHPALWSPQILYWRLKYSAYGGLPPKILAITQCNSARQGPWTWRPSRSRRIQPWLSQPSHSWLRWPIGSSGGSAREVRRRQRRPRLGSPRSSALIPAAGCGLRPASDGSAPGCT